MDKKFVDVIMNPVRQRIVQYLILHQSGTAGEMSKELSDVPQASLYRHMKILREAGLIEAISEKTVRGTTERRYALVKNPIGDPTREDISALIQSTLLSIMASFAAYFAKEETDPVKDMLSVSTSTLLLSDDEYMDMMGKIGRVYNEYIYNKPAPERKQRCLTIISSPAGKTERESSHA